MTERSKAILEQIFDSKTARVLDHLSTMRPFEFTSEELSTILDIKKDELIIILGKLQDYKLSESKLKHNIRYHKLADNKKTIPLNKLLYEIMMDFLDYHSNTTKTTGSE